MRHVSQITKATQEITKTLHRHEVEAMAKAAYDTKARRVANVTKAINAALVHKIESITAAYNKWDKETRMCKSRVFFDPDLIGKHEVSKWVDGEYVNDLVTRELRTPEFLQKLLDTPGDICEVPLPLLDHYYRVMNPDTCDLTDRCKNRASYDLAAVREQVRRMQAELDAAKPAVVEETTVPEQVDDYAGPTVPYWVYGFVGSVVTIAVFAITYLNK